jgi:hypothetical protein
LLLLLLFLAVRSSNLFIYTFICENLSLQGQAEM